MASAAKIIKQMLIFKIYNIIKRATKSAGKDIHTIFIRGNNDQLMAYYVC